MANEVIGPRRTVILAGISPNGAPVTVDDTVLAAGLDSDGVARYLSVDAEGNLANSGGGEVELGSTPSVQAFGDVAAAGASVKAAPELHKHGMPTALYNAFAKIWDQKAQNINGGTFTAGARRTRDLNTETDLSSLVTLAANQFVLAAGSYYLEAMAPAYNCNSHKAWLRNITDGVDTLIGTTANTAGVNVSVSEVSGEFTIAGAKTFEIQHQCEVTSGSELGFGRACNFDVEIYTVVKIWRKN